MANQQPSERFKRIITDSAAGRVVTIMPVLCALSPLNVLIHLNLKCERHQMCHPNYTEHLLNVALVQHDRGLVLFVAVIVRLIIKVFVN